MPYARTQVLPHRFDNLKKNQFFVLFFFVFFFIREISIRCHFFIMPIKLFYYLNKCFHVYQLVTSVT